MDVFLLFGITRLTFGFVGELIQALALMDACVRSCPWA